MLIQKEPAIVIETTNRVVDYTIVQHDLGLHLTMTHARWLRGCVAHRIKVPKFHQHGGEGVINDTHLFATTSAGAMRKLPAWPKGHCCSARSPLSMHLNWGSRPGYVSVRFTRAG